MTQQHVYLITLNDAGQRADRTQANAKSVQRRGRDCAPLDAVPKHPANTGELPSDRRGSELFSLQMQKP